MIIGRLYDIAGSYGRIIRRGSVVQKLHKIRKALTSGKLNDFLLAFLGVRG